MKKVLSMILVLAMMLTMIPASVAYADTAGEVTTSKTAAWTELGKTLNITIEEHKAAGDVTVPNILFLGTLCCAHSLNYTVVNTALEATAQYGNVDYFLYSRNSSNKIITTVSGTITKGTTGVSVMSDTKENRDNHKGYHASVYDFAQKLSECKTQNKNYDFIVMEFDGMRLGHTTTTPSTTDKAYLKNAADLLTKYYADNKVAWIIPPMSEDSNHPTYIYNDHYFDSNDSEKTNVRNTLYLLAPEDLDKTTNTTYYSVSGTISAQKTLISRLSKSSSDPDAIYVYYNNAQNVKVFLEKRFQQYYVNVTDTVIPGLTVSSIKGQYKATPTSDWTDIPAGNTNTQGQSGTGIMFSYTKTADTSGTLIKGNFYLDKIYGSVTTASANDVRMIISCTVNNQVPGTEGYLFTGVGEIATNVGNATVAVNDGPKSTVDDKITAPTVEMGTVVYKYAGTAPAGAPALPAGVTMAVGTNYTASASKPSMTGYTFSGWYTNEGCTNAYVDGTAINSNVILYGKLTANSYSVVFNANRNGGTGTGTMANQSFTYNQAKYLTTNAYTNEGYTFAGWNSKADGTGTSYTDHQSVNNLTSTNNASVNLYAQWTPHTYTVKFDANKGTGTMSNESFTYGTAKNLTANTFTRKGYTFAGWNTKADGTGTTYTDGQSIDKLTTTDGATVTLYAKWVPVNYTIVFDANRGTGTGTGTMASQDAVYDVETVLRDNAFTNTGYNFNCWNTKADGTGTNYTNSQAVKNLAETGGATVKLYAKWTTNKYTITWSTDGDPLTGDYTTGDTAYGDPIVKPNTPTKPGYTFKGWTPDVPATVPAAGTTFYATWTANSDTPYTVEHYLQNSDEQGYTMDPNVDHLTGTTDTKSAAVPRTADKYQYFSVVTEGALAWNDANIAGTGNTVIKIYYDRKNFDTDYNDFTNKDGEQTVFEDHTTTLPDLRYEDIIVVNPNQGEWEGKNETGWTEQPGETEKYTRTIDGKVEIPDPTRDPETAGDVVTVYRFTGWEKKESTDTNGVKTVELKADWAELNTNVIVNVDEKADIKEVPEIDRTNLEIAAQDALADAIANQGDDKKACEMNVTLTLTNVEEISVSDAVTQEDRETAKEIADIQAISEGRTLEFFRIVIDKETKYMSWSSLGSEWVLNEAITEKEAITDTGNPIAVTIPYYTGGKRDLAVYRYHYVDGTEANDEVCAFNEEPNANGEYSTINMSGNSFTVNASKFSIYAIGYYNVGGGLRKATLRLTDGILGEPIPGATYNLYKADGTLLGTAKTNGSGEVAFIGLKPGNYYLVETKAPYGFIADVSKNEFEITTFDEYLTATNDFAEVPDLLNGSDHYSYVVGYTDGTARPLKNISRAEVAAIFYRLLKPEIREANTTMELDYTDIKGTEWYVKEVASMSKLGIVSGYPDGSFRPNNPITRAELAVIAAKFSDYDGEVASIFTDTSTHWARTFIDLASTLGWVNGYNDNTFKPQKFISRAETMALINNVLQRRPESKEDLLEGMKEWSDNSNEGAWYYIAVQEATNSHDFTAKDMGYETWSVLLPGVTITDLMPETNTVAD